MEFLSLDEIEARQEGEKNDLEEQIKELQKNAPKKGKLRDEFDRKLQRMIYDLKSKHLDEMNEWEEGQSSSQTAETGGGGSNNSSNSGDSAKAVVDNKIAKEAEKARLVEEENRKKKEEEERKIQKAREKKNKLKEKEKEKEKEREIEKEEMRANAGPGQRKIEADAINGILASDERGLIIKDITADGNCLYRSISSELERIKFPSQMTYEDLRRTAGSYLERYSDHFAPFLELEPNSPAYMEYCQQVATSSSWGGHVELKAISSSLDVDIRIYSANSSSKLIIVRPENLDDPSAQVDAGSSSSSNSRPYIVLTYHLHYYALGEHYNAVMAIEDK